MDIISYLLGKKKGGGGGTPINNQNKNITITENGTTSVSADAGYTGLGTVGITTNVSGGADLSQYFQTQLGEYEDEEGAITYDKWYNAIKQLPALTVNTNNLEGFFNGYEGEELPETTFLQEAININNFLACPNLKTADLTGITLDYENMFLDTVEEEGQVSVNATGLDNVGYECPKLAVIDLSSMDFSQLTNEFVTAFTDRPIFYNVGRESLQTDGAYADGMPLIYVKNSASQSFVINHGDYEEEYNYDEETGEETVTKTLLWTTDNVVIKQ